MYVRANREFHDAVRTLYSHEDMPQRHLGTTLHAPVYRKGFKCKIMGFHVTSLLAEVNRVLRRAGYLFCTHRVSFDSRFHFSERFLFRKVFIPNGFYSEILIPKGHCSERFLSRKVFIPNGFNSERFLFRMFLFRKVVSPKIRNKNLSDQKPFGTITFRNIYFLYFRNKNLSE